MTWLKLLTLEMLRFDTVTCPFVPRVMSPPAPPSSKSLQQDTRETEASVQDIVLDADVESAPVKNPHNALADKFAVPAIAAFIGSRLKVMDPSDHDLHDIAVVPSSDSLDYVKAYKRKGNGKCRLHVGMR